MVLNLKGLLALIVISVFSACLSACSTTPSLTPTFSSVDLIDADPLNSLAQLMIGSFSSEPHSKIDENYYDIRLEMVRIWPQRTDGIWLYVEQASAQALEKPYRQRIYKLSERDGEYVSEVFALPEPLNFAGWWRTPALFEALNPTDLTIRQGCAVVLRQSARGVFVGGTVAKLCKSSLRGASYATSKVVINDRGIESWDQGFDDNDDQVWGAELGPYLFSRMAN